MFKLLALLCGALFLALLIGGRDTGQQRMGLTGAYAIAALTPAPARAPAAVEAAAVVRAAVIPRTTPAPAVIRPVSYSPAPETTAAAQQSGLTLALPLVAAEPAADPEAGAVQTGTDPAPLSQVNYVLGSNVNVREEPSAKSAVLDRLARGEAVTVLGSDTPGWSMIRIEGDGVEGFVATRYLSLTPPDGPASPVGD